MDLARYALTNQGEQVHIAAWPTMTNSRPKLSTKLMSCVAMTST
jgi:hypothetical protein